MRLVIPASVSSSRSSIIALSIPRRGATWESTNVTGIRGVIGING